MTKTGPNNMSHVVWALGEHLYFSLILANVFCYNLGFIHLICDVVASDDKNRPKRRFSCRLGIR